MLKNKTFHKILVGNAHEQLSELTDNSVNLVVTSPPYPMIEMWDEIMGAQNAEILKSQSEKNAVKAFELMHNELDKIWKQISRVLSPGGFVCVNIGDATRTIQDNFSLFNNHSRIISSFIKLGFDKG